MEMKEILTLLITTVTKTTHRSLMTLQAPRTLFRIERAKYFLKRQLQGRLKQFNLEQDPRYNTT